MISHKSLSRLDFRALLWFPLLAGTLLRCWNFWVPSLWLDEFATHWAAAAPSMGECWERSVNYLANSPFYFSIVRMSILIFGESEFALRLPSVLAGIFSIYLVYVLGRKAFSDEIALMAAWCFALHPWFIDQSQNARAYSLAVCFTLFASLSFFRTFDSRKTRDTLLYAIASACLIYLQFLFVLFVVFQSVFWLCLILSSKESTKREAFKAWLFAHLTVAVLIAPILLQVYRIWLRRQGLQYQIKADIPYFLALIGPEILIFISLTFSFLLVYLFLRIGLKQQSGFAWSPARPHYLSYFLIWFVLPWPFYLLVYKISGSNSILILRYLIIYFIPTSFLWGWLIASVRMPKLKALWISTFLLLNFSLYLYPNFRQNHLFSTSHGEDWRGAIRYLESNSPDKGLILLRSGLVEGDLVLNPEVKDARWKEMIHSAFGSFYVRKDWRIIDLPYRWKIPHSNSYLEKEVIPQIRKSAEFWLVVRLGQESEDFLRSFQNAIAEQTSLQLKADKKIDRFGLGIIHYYNE